MHTIYFLRHGETSYNADNNRYCGRTDIELTDKGVKQAEAVREQIKDIRFNRVFSSPLKRAYHTAAIASGKEVTTDERLIEADFGDWENKTKEEFLLENEQLWTNWMNDPYSRNAGGSGETGKQIVERVDEFFTELQTNQPAGKYMVVAHNGVNRLYLSYKLGMPLSNYRRLVQHNSTITVFTLDEAGVMTLEHLNSRL